MLFAFQKEQIIKKLKYPFNTLDEQAKIIIETDLELDRAQAELDKRINALDALQKISRLISTTLDENEIFNRINKSLIIDLGFEKILAFIYNKNNRLEPPVCLGFSEKETQIILSEIEKDSDLLGALKNGDILSSINTSEEKKELLKNLYNARSFIISPVLTQNGMIGILFAGNSSTTTTITSGDEELISILATQIGQSVENARSFEKVFQSNQDSEQKVKDRTKQLSSALEEVKNISRIKSEFISAVSHELRTPLTSIKGYASILMAGKLGEIPEKVKERLNKINLQSDSLVKLINDLLDISRIESGRVEMKKCLCHISNIIYSTFDLLTPQIEEKNIHYAVQIKDDIPKISLDKIQIERVLINLISNAIKFTKKNGTITVSAKNNKKIITVCVADNGIGINNDDLYRLFDEFYRVENQINQDTKGTGLGLALTKKIVEAHNGIIWVSSEKDKGSSFFFTLPINN